MPTQLESLTQKRDQLNARIQLLKNRQLAQRRKDETRRKLLIGAMVLDFVRQGTWTDDQLHAALDAYLHRARDRALFDLPPRPDPPETPS